MARLLPLLLALAAVLLVLFARRQAARSRDQRTYRPRGGFRPGHAAPRGGSAADGAPWVVRRSELEGLRDAWSSAALEPSRPLHRCGGCQAFYHADSLRALQADNGGRCALCGSDDLRVVHVT
ncbi:MAG: hypothetical protein MUF32_05060 [Burkholderiaceae bacterium]|jgi:hypothetical protein|nr:hypothetical protein [Burkholderiaceae bacterium]